MWVVLWLYYSAKPPSVMQNSQLQNGKSNSEWVVWHSAGKKKDVGQNSARNIKTNKTWYCGHKFKRKVIVRRRKLEKRTKENFVFSFMPSPSIICHFWASGFFVRGSIKGRIVNCYIMCYVNTAQYMHSFNSHLSSTYSLCPRICTEITQ